MNLGTNLPILPELQSLMQRIYTIGQLYAAGSLFSSRPCGPREASADVRRLHILPHGSRSLHALAESQPHPEQHSQHSGTRPTDRLDILLWLHADHLHRPGTSV
jgi:hypothetical protein